MTLLRLHDVWKTFESKDETVFAVNGVSLEIAEQETVGLIGESGSGKSTVGRLALGLLSADRGQVYVGDTELGSLEDDEMRRMRKDIQVVFQEPYESLNPRMTALQIVEEPLRIHRRDLNKQGRRDRAIETLERVGLAEDLSGRYPRELSGGQQQRVGIARAIVTEPKIVVLDEPTSSLDLSIRAQILELLTDLQSRLGLSYLFISHDLETVEAVSHRVAVMYLGKIMEMGETSSVISSPQHPYTKALLSATLSVDPREQQEHYPLEGEIPTATQLPPGCVLYGRCPIQIDECQHGEIPLYEINSDRYVACIRIAAAQLDQAVPH